MRTSLTFSKLADPLVNAATPELLPKVKESRHESNEDAESFKYLPRVSVPLKKVQWSSAIENEVDSALLPKTNASKADFGQKYFFAKDDDTSSEVSLTFSALKNRERRT